MQQSSQNSVLYEQIVDAISRLNPLELNKLKNYLNNGSTEVTFQSSQVPPSQKYDNYMINQMSDILERLTYPSDKGGLKDEDLEYFNKQFVRVKLFGQLNNRQGIMSQLKNIPEFLREMENHYKEQGFEFLFSLEKRSFNLEDFLIEIIMKQQRISKDKAEDIVYGGIYAFRNEINTTAMEILYSLGMDGFLQL
jgi:hypothetical protein